MPTFSEWLRLYTDILENPKLRKIPECCQLFYFWCLCLHKRQRLAGRPVNEIAFSLRLKPKVTAARLKVLQDAKLLLADYTPKGWDEYQYKSDSSTDRVRKFREKVAAGNGKAVTATFHSDDAKRCGNVLDRDREDREDRNARAREDDGSSGARVERVIEACRKAHMELMALGEDWGRLTFEHLVEIVRGQPGADLDRVVARLRKDWLGQRIPATRTPPMLVRQALEWDVRDNAAAGGSGVFGSAGKFGAKKNAPRVGGWSGGSGSGGAGGVLDPEMLRQRRLGGG